MLRSATSRCCVGIALGVAALGLSASTIEPIELAQSVSGRTVRLQILDPGSDGSDPMHQLELQLHRGEKPGGKTYHVLVAVYDQAVQRRSADVESVTVTVADGHGRMAARLDPMASGGEVGYGNYFDFGAQGPYRISVAVRLHGQSLPLNVEFQLAHLPQ